MPLLIECWKPIFTSNGRLEVSCMGTVRRTDNFRVMKQSAGYHGYPRAAYGPPGKVREVHRIVAEAFHGPYPPGMEIDHKDGDKTNTRASNLEYVTHAENLRRASSMGLLPRGEQLPQAVLNEETVRDIRKLHGRVTAKRMAEMYGVSDSAIRKILKGKSWTHVK